MSTLHKYISNILLPSSDQNSFIKTNTRKISNILKNNSELSLKETRPGGSFEKGTMLKVAPEADIVLVFNKKPGKPRKWKNLMNRVEENIQDNFPNDKVWQGKNVVVHLVRHLNGVPINFDIVPSFLVNSPLQMSAVKNCKIYQGVCTIWHVEYITVRKNLSNFIQSVMFLKDWKNKHSIPLKSFHIELIVASAYKDLNKKKNSLESVIQSSFQEMRSMLKGKSIVPVDWKHFKSSDIKKSPKIPCIIDPANPKSNLLSELSEDKIQKIETFVEKGIKHIERGNYYKLVDPKNKSGIFKIKQ